MNVTSATDGTIAAAFARAIAHHADSPFLHILSETASVYGIDAGTITYTAAGAGIADLRRAYRSAGYGPGHRVGLMLDNRPGCFFHWLALNALGVSVVPLNPELRPAELDYLCVHSELVLAVAAVPHLQALRRAGQRCGFAVAAEHDIPPGPGVPAITSDATDGGTECALLYTSGTTGRPKGCVLSNNYYLHAGSWYNQIGGRCALRPGAERLLTPLPMSHVNAMAFSTLAMILSGGCIIPLDRFHPRSWWRSVRESGATIVHYLGVMPSMLLSAGPVPEDRAHAVRFGFGAGVDRRHHAAFEQRFGFPLLEAWSMTETGAGAVAIDHREPRRVGTNCFGRPDPAVAYRIVDDAGVLCRCGDPGELQVRAAGPDPRAGFFSEYLKDPEATRAAWDGGWFRTGDVVREDSDGDLYFVDRQKNVIRRSGENISAVEVESVLRRHPLVAEVAVAATPDATRGEDVLACVIPRAPIPQPPSRRRPRRWYPRHWRTCPTSRYPPGSLSWTLCR